MEILLAALWLSLTSGLAINSLIYRTLWKLWKGTRRTPSPLLFFHLTVCIINSGLHAVLFVPVVSQLWMNTASMMWHADTVVCRIFTAISDFLVTSSSCSLAAIFAERLKISKEYDKFRPRIYVVTLYVSLSIFVASTVYSVLIPLINSVHMASGVPNCPANVGVIVKTPAVCFFIVANNVYTMVWFLDSRHIHAGELSSRRCGISKIWHLMAYVISGCTVWLGLACLPLYLVGFSLVSPLYNTTRLYLTALTLASNGSVTVLYEDILLNDTNERNIEDEEVA